MTDAGVIADATETSTEEPNTIDRLAARIDRWSTTREPRAVHFLRYVPGRSVLHSLWAGTKLVIVVAISVALFIWPSWRAEGVLGALILGVLLAVKIPSGAVPRLPAWIWFFVLLGAAIALAAGGKPVVHVLSFRIGVGGLDQWARFAVLAVELLVSAALVGWTTPLAELGPAFARLSSPLRRIGVPTDELAAALGLSIRCLPLVVDEIRTLRDARRARRPRHARTAREIGDDLLEMIVAALLGAIRRAAELADAIEARGGPNVTRLEHHRVHKRDVIALGLVAAVITAMALVS
ncbi:MAG TPA: energy-coupling factor transporter transmembrane protein EcfT [Acidimicrobiales bacterium]|nr:energy-coupling factor transporter transmembrane protein EcfT [Acidimicrobiales bacterium]